MAKKQRNQFDSPWKEAIGLYFPSFLQFFFPTIHRQVDWKQGYQLLDKELGQVTRDADLGRRDADLLVRVTRKSGAEAWVLLHIEVQSQVDTDFPLRMYVYNYRIFDKYARDVVSLAILGDEQPLWRPARYERKLWGSRSLLTFPVVKLLDLDGSETKTPRNPFAWLVAAHLRAQKTQSNSPVRLQSKLQLVRGLYRCGLSKDQILDFFRLVDWVLALSLDLEYAFWKELTIFEEENQMPYVTSVERIGIEKGLEKGRQEGLVAMREGLLRVVSARWENCAPEVVKMIDNETDLTRLSALYSQAALVKTVDEFINFLNEDNS